MRSCFAEYFFIRASGWSGTMVPSTWGPMGELYILLLTETSIKCWISFWRRQSGRWWLRGQWVWSATCFITSRGSTTMAEWARLEPLLRIARWNNFLLPWSYRNSFLSNSFHLTIWVIGERRRRLVRDAPVPWPSSVTHPGSPPNWEIFSWQQNIWLMKNIFFSN